MSAYADKLRDPRWQKKRLEILQRDNWMCFNCHDNTKTLHVHHIEYEGGAEPWDYPDDYYQTLCFDCHNRYESNKKEYESQLISDYRHRFKDEFLRGCLAQIFRSEKIAELVYLTWEVGIKESVHILIEASRAKAAPFLGNKPSPIPPFCPACGNLDFILFEQYEISRCSFCGTVHNYAKNTLDKA